MSYNPYEAPMPQTTAWPTEQAPAQVPGWGGPQGMAPMGPPPAPENKASPALIIVLVLLAVAAVGAGAFFLVSGDDDDNQTATNSNDDGPAVDNGPVTTLPGNPDDVGVDVPGTPTGDPSDHDGVSIDQAAAEAGPPELPPSGDPQFDDLAEQCYGGDMQACDDLYLETPVGSDYEAYGDTCGARVPNAHGYYCTDLLPNPELPA